MSRADQMTQYLGKMMDNPGAWVALGSVALAAVRARILKAERVSLHVKLAQEENQTSD